MIFSVFGSFSSLLAGIQSILHTDYWHFSFSAIPTSTRTQWLQKSQKKQLSAASFYLLPINYHNSISCGDLRDLSMRLRLVEMTRWEKKALSFTI
jgi:hypothetical protein